MRHVTGLSYTLRPVTEADRRPSIAAAYRAMQLAARRGKRIPPWDPPTAFDEILLLDKLGCFCMFVGGILVVAEVISPWYDTDARILQEHLMLRVYPDGTVQDALDALDDFGIRMNCSSIQLSSELSPSDAAMTNQLLAHGYHVAGTNHSKELS